MKVLVYMFGGIGNLYTWVPKFKGLFTLHGRDDINFLIRTHYDYEFCTKLLSKNKDFKAYFESHPDFIKVISFDDSYMPSGFDKVYDFVNHYVHSTHLPRDQAASERTKFNWCLPVASMYVHLGYDQYPVEIKQKLNHIVMCPCGQSVRSKEHRWEKLNKMFIKKGYKTHIIGDYSNNYLPADELFDLINTAKLWIGVDTGTRNIALLCKTPVVELVIPGRGRPNYNVFHPREYRNNSLFLPNFLKAPPGEHFRCYT